jgi:ankyrin repeat protein
MKCNRVWTPLHNAARNNPNVEVIKSLISSGADVNTQNNTGQTSLDEANTEEKKAILRAAGGVSGQ